MAEKKKLSSDYAFFNLLQEFYNSNKRYKGKIMRNYSLLTREFLNYNDKSVNPNAYLRKPQFEALETYILLKEFFDNKHIADILQDYIDEKGYFAKDSFYIDKAVKDGQVTITRQNVEQNKKLYLCFDYGTGENSPYGNMHFLRISYGN